MSHIERGKDGTAYRKRDVVDDLKEMIASYEFYVDETHRLWKDYKELQDENDFLKQTCHQQLETIMDYEWERLLGKAFTKKANRRKWRARSKCR